MCKKFDKFSKNSPTFFYEIKLSGLNHQTWQENLLLSDKKNHRSEKGQKWKITDVQ